MELVHLYGYLLCIYQQTFASMKALLAADTLMRSCPDRNFPFHIFY